MNRLLSIKAIIIKNSMKNERRVVRFIALSVLFQLRRMFSDLKLLSLCPTISNVALEIIYIADLVIVFLFHCRDSLKL